MQLGEHVSWFAALPLAHTGSDPLHLPLHTGSTPTLELHLHYLGTIWDTAAFVSADATVMRSVFPAARAA